MKNISVEEAIRTNHCAKRAVGEPDHKCLGTCKITPNGIELSCPLCGDGDDRGPFTELVTCDTKPYTAIAKTVLESVGMDWNALSADSQLAAIRALKSRACPGCGKVEPMDDKYHTCSCGEYEWDKYHRTWKRAAIGGEVRI